MDLAKMIGFTNIKSLYSHFEVILPDMDFDGYDDDDDDTWKEDFELDQTLEKKQFIAQ